MAAGTFTGSEVFALKQNHTGENVIRSRWAFPVGGQSLSASDIVFMARVPNRAIVTDWVLWGGNAGVTTALWKLGILGGVALTDPITGRSITDDQMIAAASLTAGNAYRMFQTIAVNAANGPFQVSLSDDNVQQFVWVGCTFTSGSTTATGSLNLYLKYLVPGG